MRLADLKDEYTSFLYRRIIINNVSILVGSIWARVSILISKFFQSTIKVYSPGMYLLNNGVYRSNFDLKIDSILSFLLMNSNFWALLRKRHNDNVTKMIVFMSIFGFGCVKQGKVL
jgi:hypothetical protein